MADISSPLSKELDTICAVSSPPGEGAISIIRASGEKSLYILNKIFKKKANSGDNEFKSYFISRKVYTGNLFDPFLDRCIDEVNCVFFKGPQTFTGEDIFEIYPHGGVFNTQYILEIILKLGARLAYNGEFTKRAHINGKISILQAEAILEIIKSSSVHNLLTAKNQLSGLLEDKIKEIKDEFLYLLAVVEALIDFADEEFEDINQKFFEKSDSLLGVLNNLISSYSDYLKFGNGLAVVIAGSPNVGKSSLLNAILQKKRAIVSDTPGTTRDYIEENLFLKNKHIKIVDTAGIRHSNDAVEKEGISLAYEQIERADLIVYVFDCSILKLSDELGNFMAYSSVENSLPYKYFKDRLDNIAAFSVKRFIFVLNKTDLLSDAEVKFLKEIIDAATTDTINPQNNLILPEVIPVSAAANTGIESLKSAIYEKILGIETVSKEDAGITTLRQKNLIEKSLEMLQRAVKGFKNKEPLEIISLDLRDAAGLLDEFTGAVSNEDVLDVLFKEFCIGK